MMLYLSRLTINRNARMAAIAPLLNPDDAGAATAAHHKLLWTLFGDAPGRRRDFLWRHDGKGCFYVLSARSPQGNDLFAPPEVKEFAPALAAGDRLGFTLRANATRTRKTGKLTKSGREHKAHDDIVMNLLRDVPRGERAARRMTLAGQAAGDWVEKQGQGRGFRPLHWAVEDYSVLALGGGGGGRKRAHQPQFGILDLTGILEVTDPAAFLSALASGFGRAKSWGCGLMLIRRV